MKSIAKVKGHDNLIMDMKTGAILNTDRSAIFKHEKRMIEIEKDQRRDAEINNIKSELSEIKQLLQLLIKKD
jgi:hypothetical protein